MILDMKKTRRQTAFQKASGKAINLAISYAERNGEDARGWAKPITETRYVEGKGDSQVEKDFIVGVEFPGIVVIFPECGRGSLKIQKK